MVRHFNAKDKRALLELVVRSAPEGEKRFSIEQHLPPDGWLVRFGEGWSIHAVAVALGIEKPQEREEKPVKTMSRAMIQAAENNLRYVLRGAGGMRFYR